MTEMKINITSIEGSDGYQVFIENTQTGRFATEILGSKEALKIFLKGIEVAFSFTDFSVEIQQIPKERIE